MSNYGGQPPTYQATTTLMGQPVAGATPYRGCVSKAFKVTGILHIIAGGVCVLLGIAAAATTANYSYIAFPIWGGLLLFVTTGILGIVYYVRPRTQGIVVAYMVMTIISASFAGVMFFVYVAAAVHDSFYWDCDPEGRGFDYDYYFCNGPDWLRVLINSLLAIIFFLETGCGVTAAAVTCFKTCKCCRSCCRGCCTEEQAQSNVMYYAPSGGDIPVIAVPANQANRPIYVSGGPSANRATPVMIVGSSSQPQPTQVQAQPVQIQTQPAQVQPQSFVQVQGQHFIQAPVQAQASNPSPAQAQGGVVIAAASPVYPTPTPTPGSQPPVQQPAQQVSVQDQTTQQDRAEEDTMEVVSGQVVTGQFSDQSALI